MQLKQQQFGMDRISGDMTRLRRILENIDQIDEAGKTVKFIHTKEFRLMTRLNDS